MHHKWEEVLDISLHVKDVYRGWEPLYWIPLLVQLLITRIVEALHHLTLYQSHIHQRKGKH